MFDLDLSEETKSKYLQARFRAFKKGSFPVCDLYPDQSRVSL